MAGKEKGLKTSEGLRHIHVYLLQSICYKHALLNFRIILVNLIEQKSHQNDRLYLTRSYKINFRTAVWFRQKIALAMADLERQRLQTQKKCEPRGKSAYDGAGRLWAALERSRLRQPKGMHLANAITGQPANGHRPRRDDILRNPLTEASALTHKHVVASRMPSILQLQS